MTEKVTIVGGGINGLVAANYLQRSGHHVTVLERRPTVGGACASDFVVFDGKRYEYPSGATVLGLMQDFVFRETGLSDRLSVYAPTHPAVVHFESQPEPCLMFDDIEDLTNEVGRRWGEEGDVRKYFDDLSRVTEYLVKGYGDAAAPSLERAARELGDDIADLWIAGSARELMDAYFTSDRMKVFACLDVTESGPVSIDSPYSAFNIPLMASGTVFGGRWGFVKGGLWKLTDELRTINEELGVEFITGAEVLSASSTELSVAYVVDGRQRRLDSDHLLFATDPVTAARVLGDDGLIQTVSGKELLGTSGKLVLLFKRPVVWKHQSGIADLDLAFRFIVSVDTLDQLESTTQAVVGGASDYVPGYFEIYCEGAGMRKLGLDRGYDSLTVFFKNLAFAKRGEELTEVRKAAEALVLRYIDNPDDLVGSVLLTPADLHDRFNFPMGNIDHVELSQGQTYFSRHYSPTPESNFYQFGPDERIRYCAAGAYPCGSIAGTPGYMCATQLITAKARVS